MNINMAILVDEIKNRIHYSIKKYVNTIYL